MPRTITRLHTPRTDDEVTRCFADAATLDAPTVLELLLDGDEPLPEGWVDNGDGTATRPGVELCAVGTWLAAAGDGNVDDDDLDAAVEADADPEVDAAPIRLGHVDPRFDGEPALGWATNLRRDGNVLLGDLVSVPRKLAGVVHTMYRRRSAGLAPPTTTPSGKTYKTRLAHLALLGATEPAVKGLADVATLLATAAGGDGARVLLAQDLSLDAQQERIRGSWSEQRRVALGDDGPYSYVVEVFDDRIIVEEDGRYYRVSYTVDGDDVTFGAARRVVRVWQDEDDPAETRPATAIFAAGNGQGSTRAAIADATLPANGSRGPGSSATAPPHTTSNGGRHMPPIDEARLRALRTIEDDADFDRQVAELLAEANGGDGGDGGENGGGTDDAGGSQGGNGGTGDGTEAGQPSGAPATQPAGELVGAGANLSTGEAGGTVTIPAAEAERLLAAGERIRVDERERLLSTAVGEGRITAAELTSWRESYDAPGGAELVTKLLAARPASSAMPTTLLGSGEAVEHGNVDEAQAKADDDTFGGI